MAFKSKMKISAAVLGIVLLAFGSYWGAHAVRDENPFLNLEVVEPGVLLRSAQPGAGDIERLHRDYGVKTILSLRHSEDPGVLAYADAHGIDWIIIKMKADVPPSDEQRDLFFDLASGKPVDLDRNASVIKKSSRAGGVVAFGRPLLLHCEGGADRTGILTALYRIEFQGWTVEEAKADMLRHWHFWFAHPGQYHYLDQYHPRRE